MSNHYHTDIDKFDFSYLKNTRYGKVCEVLEEAKVSHKKDKNTCCVKLRFALEIIISEILQIMGLEKRPKIIANLALIRDHLPEELRSYQGEDILSEMHNVRKNGNGGAHYDDTNCTDMSKAAYTSFIAMKKICKWVSCFEEKYKKYVEEERRKFEEERKRKEDDDRRNREQIKDVLMKLGKGALAIAAGALVYVLYNGRIRK